MPTDYAGVSTAFPDPIVIPDDTDDQTAASINVALEALADRDAYLAARLPQFLSTKLAVDYNSVGDAAFHQIATIGLPSYAANFVLGGTIKFRQAGSGAGYAMVRIRSSTAFGTTGTIYDEATFQTSSLVEIDFTPIIFTTTITGTHLYLEARDNGGAGIVNVIAGTNLFAMWVRT